jgi:hypothetical protein
MSTHTNLAKKAILEAEAVEMELVTRANAYRTKLMKLRDLFNEQIKMIDKQIAEQESAIKEGKGNE